MLNKIIDFSIRNKLIIGLLIIGLVGFGAYEVKNLPIDAVPDITNNQVQILTVAPALGAPDVERLITFPIEQISKNIPGLLELRSFSRFGLSVVTIVFNDNVDIYWARQQVAERLQQVQNEIPKGFGTPVLAPVTTGLGEIYQYVVRPEKGYEHKFNATELRTIQDWIVRRQLLGVEGVAEVSSFGGLLKQYEIAVNPEVLLANNITLDEVFKALENNNENTGGAYIEKNETVLFIRSEGLVGNIEDIQNIVVKNLPNGVPLLIKNVAEVQLGHATRYGAMTYNGEQEVSGAVVMMLKGANSNLVIENIKERITQIQKTLPEGVVIEPFLDRTKMVNNAISTVSKNLMEGALIVVFVLVLFLGNLRAGFLVATVIPLSMLFAIIMMNLFGVSGNLMSLGALDFGLIVDGAVIIVESVMHRLGHSKSFASINKLSQQQMDTEVKHSASRMMNSAVFGQIIILIVYLPILSLQGIEGKMFKPMAQTVAFALIGALILSLTYIPMMSSLILSKRISHKANFSDKMMSHLEQFYHRFLIKALRVQKAVLVGVVALFLFAFFLLTRLGGEFIPSLPEGDYAVETRVLPGSNLNTSVEAVSKASKLLLEQFPEIEKIVSKTGSSEIPTDPMPMDASDLMIILKNRNEWTSATTYPELEAKMSKALEVIPGVSFGFQYPVAMRFNELISGARQDVVVKIFGDNLDTLAHYADKLGKICHTVEGSTGIYVESVTGMPQIVIRYKRAAIAQFGINISDINRAVKTAFAGESSGLVYEGEKRFDLVVRLTGERRKNLADVQNLLLATPSGSQIPLQSVAEVDIEEGPNQIQRENSQRRIIVGFNVRGRDVQSTVHELQQKAEQQIKLPPGYFITYGGAFKNLEEAKGRLAVAVPVSLLLIFLLLYFAFHSVRQGLLIYTAIPLSAIGGILALSIRGIPFSVSAGIGFIALFGVAVLNGIVLIAEFNKLKAEGYNNLKRIVIQGTKLRLRPVLMTACVASLGFLPMAISTGEGAEVQRPLATVVIGGLIIATFLTLFVLPILYIMIHKNEKPKKISASFVLIVFVLSLAFPVFAQSQTPITLDEAISMALKNNLRAKSEKLNAELQKKLQGAAVDIPQTQLLGQYGQYNSIYSDNQFGIAQTISFPLVYARQKSLQHEVYKSSELNVELTNAKLKREVKQLFYLLIYIQEKEKILLQNDSMYAEFLQKSTLRYEKGESNILEISIAETQRGQIATQLNQLNSDHEILLLRFQLLLNTDIVLLPKSDITKLSLIMKNDSSMLLNHLQIQILEQEKVIAQKNTALNKSKLLPDLSFGYFNTAIVGLGADDISYTASQRFQYAQIGIGIPLFFNAQQSRIVSGKIKQSIAENDLELGLKTLKTEVNTAFRNYETLTQNISFFELKALPNAVIITETVGKQYSNGEINYLEWVILMNNVIAIQNNYLDMVNDWNQTIIQLEYLMNE
jgi:heavy metal efflux system protein